MIEITLSLFGRQFVIPSTIVNVSIVVIALTIFALIVNRKVKQADSSKKPSNFLNVIEILVQAIEDLVKQTMGEKQAWFGPFIFSLMAFLLVANLSGIVGLTPPTSDYSVTLTLALVTFTLTQFYGIKNKGIGGYLKGFAEPVALLTPINIISEIANVVSLSFRLFGNVLAGVIIMNLLSNALGLISPLISPVLSLYFDLFSGVLQTFIFGMLTMVFIGGNFEN